MALDQSGCEDHLVLLRLLRMGRHVAYNHGVGARAEAVRELAKML